MKFDLVNRFAKEGRAFIFISDFLAKDIKVIPLDELDIHDIEFCIDEDYTYKKHHSYFEVDAVDFDTYKQKFEYVIEQIKEGNTYLLNLTAPSKLKTKLTLKEIYNYANAHYKLRYKDKFVCFSPEKFIQIKDNKIHTYPMKGTIDASIPDAEFKILHNQKEMAEHTMVVDLLRNDLSIVATNVRVDRFRYTQKIDSGKKQLIQVSSHISGDVGDDWQGRLDDILKSLLPAGSISGTPKKSTLGIIKDIEGYDRGFFSGVFGVFDGKSFDSGVMIRFVEKTKEGYVYKSGGGITLDSDAKSEYEELLDKVYLP